MYKTAVIFFMGILYAFILPAQQNSNDTIAVGTLHEVIVRAYEQDRSLKDVAAPVSIVNQRQLQRFGPYSILPAVNAAPGVRMEERSPGSYRLNIRGSSLRSPFGVRNVKIYWNDIPFTDPGGNTYLNQFSFYNFSSIEIIKGPGSSLYGAGTGGVMLINSFPSKSDKRITARYSQGSFNSRNVNVSAFTGNESFSSQLAYTHQNSDGYREHTGMRRDIVSWETKIRSSEKQSISTHVLYGDLYYQTPGALTKQQFLNNPKASRPAAAGFPGAVQNQAAIRQRSFVAGMRQQYNFNEQWQNSTSVYGAFSQISNPAIRNYEKRLEPHFGGRTTFTYSANIQKTQLKLVAGGEFQQGYANIKVYKNNRGKPDSIQTDDEVSNNQGAVFVQTELNFVKGWIATAGMSLNTAKVSFNRLSQVPAFTFATRYNNELAPRVSLLKKLGSQSAVYALVSRGFSPPTTAELLPSTSVINTALQAEHGLNYELGFRGNYFANRLNIDVNLFDFRLQNALTQRRDVSGADYFVNAGDTKQQGVETAINFALVKNEDRLFSGSTVWLSHTYHHFLYRNFKQVNADLAGKKIPGISPHTVACGIDVAVKHGLYAGLTYYYSDRIPLNDANVEFASSYNLLGFKTGYSETFGKHLKMDIYFSGDNLFNQTYSLGNDINAAGNRFYNAAPGVNYTAGVSFEVGL